MGKCKTDNQVVFFARNLAIPLKSIKKQHKKLSLASAGVKIAFFFKIQIAYVCMHACMSAGPRSAVGNVSGYRCVSDCRSRGREFDPHPVPYFRGDRS